MERFFWLKPLLFKLGQLILFASVLLIEQFSGPLVFSLALYLFFVGPKPQVFEFVFFTLVCSGLIALVTLLPWWSVSMILFLALIVMILGKNLLKSFRLSLILTAVLASLVLYWWAKLPWSFTFGLRLFISSGLLSLIFLSKRPISFSGYNWHLK